MRKASWARRLVLGTLVATAVGLPAAVDATPALAGSYYYNRGVSNGQPVFYGIYTSPCYTAMSVNAPSANHLTDEMWLSFGSGYWTEVGSIVGPIPGGYTNQPLFFWYDENTKYGGNWHMDQSGNTYYGPSPGVHYASIIYNEGQPWYAVGINGWYGNSWHNAAYGNQAQVGAELYDSGGANPNLSGAAQNTEEWSGGSSWDPYWYNPWPAVSFGQGFWYQSGHYWSFKTSNEGWSC